MLIIAIALLILNIVSMFFFFFKIRARFSFDNYESLLRERMSSILRDFNFHTDQAVTILEDRIGEMKKLMADADKRFIALSKKMESASIQTEKMNEVMVNKVVDENKDSTDTDPIKTAEVYSFKGNKQDTKFLKMKIIEMYKNGWSIDFIADKLSMPIEEVRLIAFMSNTHE